ncbi:MAG TPA: hypothetical protein VEY95_14170 [Azospirillaceae bacterium]|nr:hypothetical protein [Azospirillaceae bacterium]
MSGTDNLASKSDTQSYTRTIGRELAVMPLTAEQMDEVSGGVGCWLIAGPSAAESNYTSCQPNSQEFDDCD